MPRRFLPALMVSLNNPVAYPNPGHTIKTNAPPYTPICIIPHSPASYTKQTKYACLFAASPSLLHAIEECLPDLAHYASTHGPGPDRRLAALREVIDRAKGWPTPSKKSAKS